MDKELIRHLFDSGYSRNRIGAILHLGHVNVQRAIKDMDKTKHNAAKEARRQRTKDLVKEKLEAHPNLTQAEAENIVRRNQDLGIRARYDTEYEEIMLNIKAKEGSP